MIEGWVMNGGVRLHYLDNQGGDASTPVLIVQGLTSAAEHFTDIAEALLPRRAVSVSLRGRGARRGSCPPVANRVSEAWVFVRMNTGRLFSPRSA